MGRLRSAAQLCIDHVFGLFAEVLDFLRRHKPTNWLKGKTTEVFVCPLAEA